LSPLFFFFFFNSFFLLLPLHSFPTRRSSDLAHIRFCFLNSYYPRLSRWLTWLSKKKNSTAKLKSRCVLQKKYAAVSSSPHLTIRSEEHTSELQSRGHLVCRLLLEKKKNHNKS